MQDGIQHGIIINAGEGEVWDALTKPEVMKRWMAEPEMEIEIFTKWIVGGPIVIKGFHHVKFENRGTVLKFEPNKILEYTYLSSLSKLPDRLENYTHTAFQLVPQGNNTLLRISLHNFPTEVIYKHVEFYWASTPAILKQVVEENAGS